MIRDATALATSAALLGLAAFALARRPTNRTLTVPARRPPLVAVDPDAAVRAARRMNRAAAVIGARRPGEQRCGEHYRGAFHNSAMVALAGLAALGLMEDHPDG